MPTPAAAAVLLAGLLDHQFAEPPAWAHPVVWLGKPIAVVDRRFRDSRIAGIAATLLLPLTFAALAAGIVWAGIAITDAALPAAGAGPSLGVIVGAIVAGTVLFACSSLRMLTDISADVAALTDQDLDRAREELLALAGRDPTTLSKGQVRSAAVESAAENLADGLVAPIGAFAVVAATASTLGAPAMALPAAAGAAAWVKGVNTLDSMLGYREKAVGWAPARLDDAVMWLPARATAVLIAFAALSPGMLRRARSWARIPSSPNSGWPMATMAAVLDVRLEKPGVYVLNPNAALPTSEEAANGVALVGRAGWLTIGLAGVIAAV